ncbi:MAG: MerR family transcriptional regulator [Fastidiosipilaceae bacterium]|jgi:DNA-binding transcriptional MerR regulator|nr:MerR family transcriptional regulator [Clostridiaceae bacterium]
MNFTEVCERSNLPPEAVRFYVESKLLAPLYPRRNIPDEGEYADEDIRLLNAIANLRRLDFSIDSIRLVLLDQTKMPEVTEANHSALIQVIDISRARLDQLNKLELEDFSGPEEVIDFFSSLSIDIPLPRRDVDKDEGQKTRNEITERKREIDELLDSLNNSERKRRNLRAALIIVGLLLIIALGWIIAPLWMVYLPKP